MEIVIRLKFLIFNLHRPKMRARLAGDLR